MQIFKIKSPTNDQLYDNFLTTTHPKPIAINWLDLLLAIRFAIVRKVSRAMKWVSLEQSNTASMAWWHPPLATLSAMLIESPRDIIRMVDALCRPPTSSNMYQLSIYIGRQSMRKIGALGDCRETATSCVHYLSLCISALNRLAKRGRGSTKEYT